MFLAILALLTVAFNACSGAGLRKQAILNSLNSSLDRAQIKELSEEEAVKEVEKTIVKEKAPPKTKPDPKEFTHFPYDLQLDTIAYMGYAAQSLQEKDPYYFTFRAGAYFSRSGLRMSEYFLDKKKSGTSIEDLIKLIKSSTQYSAMPYFKLVHKSSMVSKIQNIDQQFLFRPYLLVKDMVEAGENRIRTIEGDPIEISLPIQFAFVNLMASDDNRKNAYRLFSYYRVGKESLVAHIPDYETPGGLDDVYGRLYKIKLKREDIRGKDRYKLQSVTEQRLPKKHFKQQKPWICPNSLQFEVRRHPDRAWSFTRWYADQERNNPEWVKAHSALKSTRTFTNDGNEIKLQENEQLCDEGACSGTACAIATKVLGSDWTINTSQKCVSLKSPSNGFYMELTPQTSGHRLANRGQKCSTEVATYFNQLTAKAAHTRYHKYCPFFLSICVRQN